jgi:hypothetical protein
MQPELPPRQESYTRNSLQAGALNAAYSGAAGSVYEPSLPGLFDTQESTDSSYLWARALCGSVWAIATAWLYCDPIKSHGHLLLHALVRSAWYIVLSAGAGAAGIWLIWSFLGSSGIARSFRLSSRIGVAWVFLPCILLLYDWQSPVLLVFVAFATFLMAVSVRGLWRAETPAGGDDGSLWLPDHLPNLYGLPAEQSHPVRMATIALCAQGTFVFSILGDVTVAGFLLATGLLLLVWQWSAIEANRAVVQRWTSQRASVLLCVLAFLITAATLIAGAGGRLSGGSAAREASGKPPDAAQGLAAQAPQFDYVGIILWPPPVKKTKILMLPPPANSFAPGTRARPVVIPFDGPYWYFKAPSKRPAVSAHLAHAKPTEVNIHSTDFRPLHMEAHQDLGSPIELRRCGEIDLAITNNDARLGKIELALTLTDSTTPGQPSVSLGEKLIASSAVDPIPMNRPAVKEVLHFLVPRSSKLSRFDAIAVDFLPAKERSRGGARVSIRRLHPDPAITVEITAQMGHGA